MRVSFIIAAAVFGAAGAAAAAEPLWRVDGLRQPESALYDAARGRIVVSNIDGAPGAADGAGYLSLLDADGGVLAERWVDGLDAPKGMALLGDDLLVADLTRLHVIDARSGALKRSATAPGAVFLNDVAVGGGAAWITDLAADAIWRFADGALTLWMQDRRLQHPNGVLYDGDRLIVGAWGAGLRPDFSTELPGDLIAVDLHDKSIRTLARGLGNLDGLARLDGAVYVSDWVAGSVFRVDGARAPVALRGRPGVADISAFGGALLLPLMHDGALEAWPRPATFAR